MNAAVASMSRTERPARLMGIGALLVAICLLYWPALLALHALWVDTERTTYTHGYLIVAVSALLLWQNRRALAAAPLRPAPLAMAALLVLAVAWQFACFAGIQTVYIVLLPLLMWTGVCAVFGMWVARGCAFALGYLYFAMPVWDNLNSLAQWGTIYAVQLMLRAVGVAAYFDEHRVQLQSGTFEIEGGCSGLHFIMVGLALAVLLGEMRRDDLKTRLKLVGLMLALAIATNWVRVFVIIVAGDLSHMQHYLVTVSHYGFGWCVFAVALLAFFLIERRIQVRPASKVPPPDAARGGVGVQPARVAGIACAVLVVAALPRLADAFISSTAPKSLSAALPAAARGWTGPHSSVSSDWQPVFEGVDLEQHAIYRRGEGLEMQEMEFYAAWFAVQRQGKELGGYRNAVTGMLTLVAHGEDEVVSGHAFHTGTVTDSHGQRSVVWYAYRVRDRWFTNPLRAQLRYSLDALTHLEAPVSKVIAGRARCLPDCTTANGNLRSFFASSGDEQ